MAFAAAAVPYVMAAAAAVSAYSAVRQGQAAKAAATFNETVDKQNADIARANAQAQAKQQDRENFLRLGAIRAAQGKNGGAAGEGSVLDIIGDVAAQGELEKQNILYQGELQARGYGNTATLDRFQGKNALTSSYYKAASDLLEGGSQAYMTSQKLKRN